MANITAIIPAAGQGSRMNAKTNKQYLLLRGEPVLVHTLRVFEECSEIGDMILVIPAGNESYARNLIAEYGFRKKIKIVTGGQERQDSVARGLAQLAEDCERVVVHDGARPLLPPSHLHAVCEQLEVDEGVILAVPVKDTIKIADQTSHIVTKTLERKLLWSVQTPQAFKKEVIVSAYYQAAMEGFFGTDDAALVERYGGRVRIIQGSYENIKITTPDDLIWAEMILKGREKNANRDGI